MRNIFLSLGLSLLVLNACSSVSRTSAGNATETLARTMPAQWPTRAVGDIGDGWSRSLEERVRRNLDYVTRTGHPVVVRDDEGRPVGRISIGRSDGVEAENCRTIVMRRTDGNSTDSVLACSMSTGEVFIRRPEQQN